MAALIETAASLDARNPEPLVVTHGDADLQLVGLFDGSGSWGGGVEAAAWFRQQSAEALGRPSIRSVRDVAQALTELSERLPQDVRVDELGFGWAFSLAIAVLERQVLSLLTSGVFGVVICRGSVPEALHTPQKIADDLLAPGFTASEVDSANVSHIFSEPFFGDDRCDLPVRGPFGLQVGDRVVIAHRDVLEMRPAQLCELARSGAQSLRARAIDLQCNRGPIATISVTGNLAASGSA